MNRRSKQWRTLSPGAESVERGRFRKRKPLDCGRARCGLCHGEKLHGRPSFARKRLDDAAARDIREWQGD
jgi:hypothetical protein